MITFATTFFKHVYFEAAICVNLTNMLVMTTIFTSVMEKLPPTSYPKMIDIWLIFCQLFPFTEVMVINQKHIPPTLKFPGHASHCDGILEIREQQWKRKLNAAYVQHDDILIEQA